MGEGTVPGVHSLGSWTQRLDVAIRDHSTDLNAECGYLADIILSLPNLAIMSFAVGSASYTPSTSIPPGVFDALRSNGSSLRVLDWSADGIFPAPRPLEELLKELPHLRILHSHALPWKNGLMPTKALSWLHTLIVPSLLSAPDHCFGPVDTGMTPINLREVVLSISFTFPWGEFMRCYGIHLTSVQVRQWYPGVKVVLIPFLGMIHRTCPNLRRITLTILKFSHLPLNGFFLLPIEYLRVSAEAPQQPRSAYWNLFMILASVRDTVPTLRVVQFINPRNVDALLTQHTKLVVCP